MNKAFKLVFAILFPVLGFSQNSDSTKWNGFTNLYESPYKAFEPAKILGVRTNGILSTKGISNDFIYPFIFRKRLEKGAIDNNIARSGNKKLMIESDNEVSFINLESNLFHKKTINWYIKAGTHHRGYVNVINDAVRLFFKGNTETTRYSFENSSYYNLRLNKIGGGLFYHVEKTAKPFNLSVGINIMQVMNYGNVKTLERNYYQGDEDSFMVGINYDAMFAGDNSISGSGYGIGSELLFNQKLNGNATWGMRLENFGIVSFKKRATTYSGHGEYSFDGVFIPEVNRLTEDDYFKHQLDSFTNPLTNKRENQSKTVLIAPVSFVYYNIHLKSGYYQLGVRHNGTLAKPVAELRYFSFVRSNLLVGASVGTVGAWYLNTDVNWAINRQWFMQAGLYHLEALAVSRKLGGVGGNLGLQFVF